MHVVNSALRAVSRASAVLAAVAVGIAALVYVAEVVARYGFNDPLNWSGDAGSYMLCAMVFLALPMITRQRGHIAVTVVVETLPRAHIGRVTRLLELLSAAVLLIVAFFVIELSVRQHDQGVLTTMANQIPRWWLTAVMAFGIVLSALNFIAPADERPAEVVEL
ncbi:MAG: TRAP transporter small permease [Mesorhizobium sp.]|nr:TRAP transporter small permease [Mesorhizobium sp.]MCO5162492.1 TRAP transporter small permease [Mesorhizobium sp.]